MNNNHEKLGRILYKAITKAYINNENKKFRNATNIFWYTYTFLFSCVFIKKFLFPISAFKHIEVPELNNPYNVVPVKTYNGKAPEVPLPNILEKPAP